VKNKFFLTCHNAGHKLIAGLQKGTTWNAGSSFAQELWVRANKKVKALHKWWCHKTAVEVTAAAAA
jgi:hypothetical protein